LDGAEQCECIQYLLKKLKEVKDHLFNKKAEQIKKKLTKSWFEIIRNSFICPSNEFTNSTSQAER